MCPTVLENLDTLKASQNVSSACIFKESVGARNRVGIGLSYRPARLHRLAEFVPWNRFLGVIKVLKNRALVAKRKAQTSYTLKYKPQCKRIE
jgi:hypothetical protein